MVRGALDLVKERLVDIIGEALYVLRDEGFLISDPLPHPRIETPRDTDHGDFSSNIAMILASREKKDPRKLAERISTTIGRLSDAKASAILKDIEVAGPGFINFTISENLWRDTIREIIEGGDAFGWTNLGEGKKVQVEFVSANPTGPLHIGHARGAVVGDTLANILKAQGYRVEREYYINDAGIQIETLGRSVFTRYLELFGKKVVYKDEYYQGDYIKELALSFKENEGDRLLDLPEGEAVSSLSKYASSEIIRDIEKDLTDFGVNYDVWFSEKTLYDDKKVDDAIKSFKEMGLIYEKDGALWFDTTNYGDDKDRVVVKSDGEKTYLASDIAYHKDKFQRGFDRVINVWGADHHGYVVRMKAAVRAMGRNEGDLEIILVQLVNLTRGGKPISMSTRAGKYVTLREVLDEVGSDAMRYFMLMRSHDSHLEFDLELAKKTSQENPVYYVQYAHARISSIIRQAEDKGYDGLPQLELIDLSLIDLEEELSILKRLRAFPEVVKEATDNLEPHRIVFYIYDLAQAFHSYYAHHRVVTEDRKLSDARLALVSAIMVVIRNGLGLLGISAPDRM